jgi:O-antigen/teichoic acid export membrane protein/SAM-dependent methyltransferase
MSGGEPGRRSLSGNALWNVAAASANIGVTFLVTPYMLSRIGASHYGLLLFLLSLTGFMGVMDFGIRDATLRFVSHYHGRGDLARVNRVVGTSSALQLAVGCVGAVGIFSGAGWLAVRLGFPADQLPLGVEFIRLGAVYFLAGFLGGAFAVIPRALERYDVTSKVVMLQVVVQGAGSVAVLRGGGGIVALMRWNIVVSLAFQALSLLVARRLLPGLAVLPSFSRPAFRELSGYGVFSSLNNVLSIVWAQADRLLLGMWVSTASVGFLAVPQQLCFRGLGLVSTAGAALLPRFSALTDRGAVKRLYLLSTWAMFSLSVLVFVPVTVLLPDFLRVWIGGEFARQSGFTGQIIAASCIVIGAFFPYQMLLAGLGKPHLQTVQSAASAVTGLALNLALIPRLGLRGAGISYLVTSLVGFAAIFLTWRGVLESDSLRPLVRPVGLPLVSGLVALAVCAGIRSVLPEPGWVGLVGWGAAFLAVTALLLAASERGAGGADSYVHFAAGRLRLALGRPAAGVLHRVTKGFTAHQRNQCTSEDRYPGLFAAAREIAGGEGRPLRILSYGCSTGEEAHTLRRYFPEALVVACDVEPGILERAASANTDPRVLFVRSTPGNLEQHGPYDLVFCLSVLCRWPESGGVDDLSRLYPFRRFEEALRLLDSVLVPGGILALYNCNYRFRDSTLMRGYAAVSHPQVAESGFVHKFGRDQRKLAGWQDDECLFRKRGGAPAAGKVASAS